MSSYMWMWVHHGVWCRHESQPLCVRATYISPLCRWACFFCSYVRHLTHYLHSSLRPFPSPLLRCLTGIDFKVKTIEVDGKKVKLQVWSVGDSCSVSLISFPGGSETSAPDAAESPAFCCVERGISSLISKSRWHCTIPDAHLVHSPVSPIHIACIEMKYEWLNHCVKFILIILIKQYFL